VRTKLLEPENEKSTPPIHPCISQMASAREERFERDVKRPRGCYGPKLEPSNELNHRESNRNRALPKNKGSNRNPSIGGRIRRLRGHDQAQKLHEATIHDLHQQIRTETPKNQRNKSCTKIQRKYLEKHTKTHTSYKKEIDANHESFHTLRGQILYKMVKKI
jgi:hypothetical protein